MNWTTGIYVLVLHLLVTSLSSTADTNIALGKAVTRSSAFPHAGWLPGNAVDGDIDLINENTCDCCSATEIQLNPWFRVDLGGMFMVSAFNVYTRKYGAETFNPTDIYLHIDVSDPGTAVTTIKEDVITYNHTFTSPVTARYVTVKYIGYRLFMLCEIEVFGECLDGTFGDTCSSVCHCEISPCNKTSGICPSGKCIPGYSGENCDKKCPANTYGPNCAKTCGRCKNNEFCHHVNGSCTQCEDGYTGTRCKQECPPGIYGQNCRETCGNCYKNEVCGHVDGTCTRCEAGYTGNTCKENCASGRYGQDCASKCGSCEESPCNHITGICSDCSPGYLTQYCNKVCPRGKYGYNCNSTCGYCLVNTTCHHENGRCVFGCNTGYIGSTCDIEGTSTDEQNDGGDSSAVLGGVIGIVVVVLLVVGIVGFVYIRRRGLKDCRMCVNGATQTKQTQSNSTDGAGTEVTFATLQNQPALYEQLGETGHNNRDENVYDSICPDNVTDHRTTDGADYYNVRPSKITVAGLWKYIYSKKANRCDGFQKEYKMLKDYLEAKLDRSSVVAIRDENKRSNVRKVEPGISGEITVTYIDGYDRGSKFISIEGPKGALANELWSLVLKHKAEIIVMLSDGSSAEINKTEQYWPGEDGQTEQICDVAVKLIETQFFPEYDTRTLKAKQKSTDVRVTQYHFKVWPSNGVPDTTWCFVKFWRMVNCAIQNTMLNSPVIVHCSNEIGRAGTFVALDKLHHQAVKEGCVSPVDTVSKLWKQNSKQQYMSVEQYVYLHEALADSLLFGTHFVWTTQMEEIDLFMQKSFSIKKDTHYDEQFKMIQESVHGGICDKGGPTVLVQPVQVPNYFMSLGASYLPTFPDGYGIIQMKTPTPTNLHDFWTLVAEKRSKTIIMIPSKKHDDYKIGSVLGSESQNIFGSVSVKFSEERKKGSFMHRIFKMEGHEKASRRIIAQYVFTSWDEDSSVPRDIHSLIDMLNHLTSWQTQLQQKEPVIVYCGDGATRSGLISVLLNEVNRIRSTGDRVNIVESVKTMKDVNKNIILTSEQLRYCYKAILCYLGKE